MPKADLKETRDFARSSVSDSPSSSTARSSWTTSRALAGVLALVAVSPLVTAAFLSPSAAGHGTHAQLGIPPCGWAMYFNKPCFTCGMTTAFAHAARFDFVHAWLAQPMGLVLALLCGVGFWACLHSALTGSVAAALLGSNLARPRVLIVLAILGAGAWAYKWATWTGF